MDIMRSIVGMAVLLIIAFLLSVNKKRISLRTTGAALVLQIAIGGIMLYFPPGKWLVEQAALGVHKIMSYSDAGSAFIFGSLVGDKMDVLFDGAGFIFAFRVLPAIIFVTALISLLYYIRVMGGLIRILGGILFARILSPATEESKVTFENLSFTDTPPKSVIEAVASGAMTGLKIAVGVATVVMTFVAIIALINGIIGGIGGWFGYGNITLEGIFGWILAPLAWIMGVDWADASLAGSLIGQKLAINEFVAYLNLSPYLQPGSTLDVKTTAIISFALCGFANFGSIGVVVGAFSAISPQRAPEIAQLGMRALAAATLSNLMSATIAGFFIGLA
ncbi:TPA: hypothetical protein J4Z66_004666 [Escherichia coli]|nr:hypothetical protein [Escherichia coli]